MSKKLLIIMGSPRKDGIIANTIAFALSEGEKVGWDITTINVYDWNLQSCKGCMKCRKTGVCILEDNFAEIREQFINCDMVIIAAPTYLANIPAPIKNVFDRLVGAVIEDTGETPKPKQTKRQKYLLVTACTTRFPLNYLGWQSVGAIRAMNELCKIAGMKKCGQVILAGTRKQQTLNVNVKKKIKKVLYA